MSSRCLFPMNVSGLRKDKTIRRIQARTPMIVMPIPTAPSPKPRMPPSTGIQPVMVPRSPQKQADNVQAAEDDHGLESMAANGGVAPLDQKKDKAGNPPQHIAERALKSFLYTQHGGTRIGISLVVHLLAPRHPLSSCIYAAGPRQHIRRPQDISSCAMNTGLSVRVLAASSYLYAVPGLRVARDISPRVRLHRCWAIPLHACDLPSRAH